jgi:gamma-glutamyl:cysteine ligase YbdK (ATP-grasp superfamily)
LPGDSRRVDYVQNRWAAARFGPRANLIHPDGLSFPTATELAGELFERVRPAAEQLGAVELLARLDPSRCEADEQLDPPAPREVAAALVRRSLA